MPVAFGTRNMTVTVSMGGGKEHMSLQSVEVRQFVLKSFKLVTVSRKEVKGASRRLLGEM